MNEQTERGKDSKERWRERDSPLMPADTSRLNQFATQSETCAMFEEDLYVVLFFFFQMFKTGDGFEL